MQNCRQGQRVSGYRTGQASAAIAAALALVACQAPSSETCGAVYCPARTHCVAGSCVADVGACAEFSDGAKCRLHESELGACNAGACHALPHGIGGDGGSSGQHAGGGAGAAGATGGTAGGNAGSAGAHSGGAAGAAGSGGGSCEGAADGASCSQPGSASPGMCSSGTCAATQVFSGVVGRADNSATISGATLTLRRHPGAQIATSAGSGAYQISVPSISDVSVEVSSAGFIPSITAPIDVAQYGGVMSTLPIATTAHWTNFHLGASLTRDPSRGSIVLNLRATTGEARAAAMSPTPNCEAGPLYTEAGAIFPDLQATGVRTGTVIWLNCAPGMYELSADHPSLSCKRSAPVASPNFPVEVVAGAVSLAGGITCD